MTVTTNEYGQQNMFAKEPQMVVESYNRKGLESPQQYAETYNCLLYTSPSPRDGATSRMPSSA